MSLDPVVAGHPIHPSVIPLPVGLFPASYVLDILAMTTDSDSMAEAAYYNMLIGYAGAAAALTSGYLDYRQMAKNDPAKKMAFTHGVMNAALAGIYSLNLLVRLKNKRSGLGFLLSTLGTAGLMVSGYLGGEIAYGRGWRVRPVERFELEWQKLRKTGLFSPNGQAGEGSQQEEYPQEIIKGFEEHKSGEAVLEDIKQGKTDSSFEQIQSQPKTAASAGSSNGSTRPSSSSSTASNTSPTSPPANAVEDKPSQAEGER